MIGGGGDGGDEDDEDDDVGGVGEESWRTNANSVDAKSKIKVSAGLVSPEGALHVLRMAALSLCPHRAFSQCSLAPSLQPYWIRTHPNGPVLTYLSL